MHGLSPSRGFEPRTPPTGGGCCPPCGGLNHAARHTVALHLSADSYPGLPRQTGYSRGAGGPAQNPGIPVSTSCTTNAPVAHSVVEIVAHVVVFMLFSSFCRAGVHRQPIDRQYHPGKSLQVVFQKKFFRHKLAWKNFGTSFSSANPAVLDDPKNEKARVTGLFSHYHTIACQRSPGPDGPAGQRKLCSNLRQPA